MNYPVSIAAAEGVLPGRDLAGCRMSNERLCTLMEEVAAEFDRRGVGQKVPISTPEFAEQRIGVRSRCVLDQSLSGRDLAVLAAERALRTSGVAVEDIRCVIVSTVTPDRVVPALATTVHDRLGLPPSIPAFDLSVGCNGFMNALDIGQRFLESEREGTAVLVIGADTMTRVLDASDRATCAIFGDGGGAVVLMRTPVAGMTRVRSRTLGDRGDCIQIRADTDAGKSPLFRFTARDGELSIREDRRCRRRVHMAGRNVFKDMLRLIPEFITSYLREQHTDIDDVDAFVFHQANLRMIEGIAASRTLRIPEEKLLHNIETVGNTTSASIPIVLGQAAADGRLRTGNRVALVGFGTGYSLGITLLTWQ